MLVFLLNDTQKKNPTGYEEEHRNLFDPADDFDEDENPDEKGTLEVNLDSNRSEQPNNTCLRPGCDNKPRFDSLFCSDACGVCTLENDLLRSFNYASDMHPSSLRH
jgi:hypothetical protein